MKINFIDLAKRTNLHMKEYMEAVEQTFKRGIYILGDEVNNFENRFANYHSLDYAVGLNSGLDALIFAVKAVGIGKGDEVLVQANTFIATILAITQSGATPVFVEPNEFFNIDSSILEKYITPNTKAIIPVHLYGQPSDMVSIMQIANKHNLFVIEDCAQAHGAELAGRKVGTFGHIGCFSFYPTKPLGAFGDGGMIITNNLEYAKKIRMLRNYGSEKKYYNDMIGFNSRLDELQASLLSVGLNHLDEENEMRINIANQYLTRINNDKIILPLEFPDSKSVYHLFVIRASNRLDLQKYLSTNNIETQIHYPVPPHLQKCYEFLGYTTGDFPKAEEYSSTVLSLPIYSGMSQDDVNFVIDVINLY
ncbi:MAG: DegT/DnrJ/EryC1/StrS family aminotransferase [Acholeplasma sp.]|nr:DegT/DnrJ/EryC1/StrS family aminotransferase [Acholeplasma sp.]